MTGPAISILLAHIETPDLDRVLARLTGDERFNVISTVAVAGDLVAVAAELQPRVVVVARYLSEPEVLRLRGVVPGVRILVFAEPDREGLVAGMRSGVSGFVDSARMEGELTIAILQVAAGQSYLSGSISDLLLADMRRSEPALASHERQVLDLVSRGMTSSEIACEVGLSMKTVERLRDRKARFLP